MVLLRRSNLAAWKHHVIGDGWTQSLYYLTIGLILIVFPASLNLTDDSLTGFVFAILYLMNPVWGIIGAFPAVSRGRIALARIDALGMSLKPMADSSPALRLTVPAACPVVVLQGVTFSYDPVGGQPGFTLGPVDFTVRPGEVVFIIGGNGSGKSTFVKLLTGLYKPDKGTISLGGLAVTDENRGWYRTHFAAVFSDFHVFERLPVWGPDTKDLVNTYLSLLELEGKVTVTDGRWSTTNLSQGQRRRLALLTAFVENRSVYVFDEWAADQDPHYKSVFYNRLLPELSGRGKAVVVITHDDRYFSLGDRVVKLEDGRVVDAVSHARQPA
jgi:putative ATP-binding cassette transporter